MFNGPDYVEARDKQRLLNQRDRVFSVMADGVWRTLEDITRATGDPHASISAQLRHLRKPRFGGHTAIAATSETESTSTGCWPHKLREVVSKCLQECK